MPVEIAKAGRWPASGQVVEVTSQMLSEVAQSYDPAKFRAPFLVTHDETGQPNWKGTGFTEDTNKRPWKAGALIKNLFVKGDILFAEPEKVDPDYKQLFDSGRIPALSAKFYRPEDPGNPTPGKWGIRHVAGVLIPGIKGMAVPEFAEAEQGLVVQFAEMGSYSVSLLEDIFNGIRDYLTDVVGSDEAERYMPRWRIRDFVSAMKPIQIIEEPMAFQEQHNQEVPVSDPMDLAKISELETLLAAERQKAMDLQKQAEQERAQSLRREAVAFAESLLESGRLIPAERQNVVAEYLAAANSAPVEFEEGGAMVVVNPLASYKARLLRADKQVEFGELATFENEPGSAEAFEFAEGLPPGTVISPAKAKAYAAAKAYAQKNGVDIITAYRAVGGK